MNQDETAKKLNTTEAAAYVGLSPRTLAALRVYRQGPPFHKAVNGRVSYGRSELDAFIARRKTA